MFQPNLVRGFLLSKRERNITVNENKRQHYFSMDRESGQRKRADGIPAPFPGVGIAAGAWMLQLQPQSKDLDGVG